MIENTGQLVEATQSDGKKFVDPISNADSPITALGRLAASGASREVVEQMKGLIEWDDARRARAEFNAAFSNAKQKFKKAKKSGYNSHLKANYSMLEDLDDATREALSEFGLSWRHVPATLAGDITSIRCILAHKGGHSEEAELSAPSGSMKNNAVNALQSVGIVVMYLKRLTLAAMLGIVSDSDLDNDGSGGAEYEKINEKQAADLKALAEEVKADIPAFLKYLSSTGKMTITSIEDIPANMHKEASLQLQRKRNQKPKSG